MYTNSFNYQIKTVLNFYYFDQTDSNINELLCDNIELKNCQNEICFKEIEALEKEIACNESKYEEIKQKYQTALVENLKKDLVLDSLIQKAKEHRFSGFSEFFPSNTLIELNLIGPSEKDDSSFVSTTIRSLYSDNLALLETKTLSGKSKENNKEAMSPAKVVILKNIYDKRMEYLETDCLLTNKKRKKNFSKHVKTALESINKSSQ